MLFTLIATPIVSLLVTLFTFAVILNVKPDWLTKSDE